MMETKKIVYMAVAFMILLTACDNDVDVADRMPWNDVKDRENVNPELAEKISNNDHRAYYKWYGSYIFERDPSRDWNFRLEIIVNREGDNRYFGESEYVSPKARYIGFDGADMLFSPVGFVDRWIFYGITWFFGDFEDYINDNYLLRQGYVFDVETLEFRFTTSSSGVVPGYRLMAIDGKSMGIQCANSNVWDSDINIVIEENFYTIVDEKEFFEGKKIFDNMQDLNDELASILKEKGGDEFEDMKHEWESI